MNIEDIENQWEKDCKIDPLNIEQSSVDSYELHKKYMKFFNQACRLLARAEIDRSKLMKLRTDYWLRTIDHETLKARNWKPNPLMVVKTDLPGVLAADDELVEINLRVADLNQIVKYCDSIIRVVNNRGFAIRNIIENRKFENGSN